MTRLRRPDGAVFRRLIRSTRSPLPPRQGKDRDYGIWYFGSRLLDFAASKNESTESKAEAQDKR